MASFTLTPVEKGILRCRHTGPLGREDIQSLARFLSDYRGRLLVDLRDADPEECRRHLHNLRPMMPTSAVFGAPGLDQAVVDAPASYYTHEVRVFEGETEALAWLRDQ